MNLWPFRKMQTAPETLRALIDEYHKDRKNARLLVIPEA